jgi:2-polyprenyl-3-methyl-5-hydroxy-6-metoxy-1,4-benzoquinol methylase
MHQYQQQKLQEEEYSFPYHYIPQFSPHFNQNYNIDGGFSYAAMIEFIVKEISKMPFNSLCDVGTGDGRLIKELSDILSNKELLGVDYSERAINLAQAMNPRLEFKKYDITKNELNKKFDIVTLIETFEHIPIDEANEFINSLYKMVNENGTLILTVPHKNLPLEKKHFRHFNSKDLEKCFADHFTLEEKILLEKQNKTKKIIKKILTNNLFILNEKKTKNLLYNLYKKYCFFAEENNCGRIYMKFKKNKKIIQS